MFFSPGQPQGCSFTMLPAPGLSNYFKYFQTLKKKFFDLNSKLKMILLDLKY